MSKSIKTIVAVFLTVLTMFSATSVYAASSAKNGWYEDAGHHWYYYVNNVKVKGEQKISNKWYYFDYSTGVMKTGWQRIESKWHYYSSSGAMLTGWQYIGGTWYYFNNTGEMITGWLKDDNRWYYFNTSGAMATGDQKINGKWYYFAVKADKNNNILEGQMCTGWTKSDIDGSWFYFNTNGERVTGWLKDGSKWYYLCPSMCAATSKIINGKRYYFGVSGACLNP